MIRNCKSCNKEFNARIHHDRKYLYAMFCSMKCRSKVHNTRKDLTGKVFGRLTVLSLSHSDKYNNCTVPIWNVKCSCGTEKKLAGKNLSSGKTTSCGCEHKEKTFGKACVNIFYCEYKSGAERRNLPFEIDINQFKTLVSADCYYCGSAPILRQKSIKMNGKLPLNGIDRVDNSLGYTNENSVSCCSICNKMKLTLGVNDFLSHIEKISHFQKIKNNKFPPSYLTVIS